jgi:hypothetical protein
MILGTPCFGLSDINNRANRNGASFPRHRGAKDGQSALK